MFSVPIVHQLVLTHAMFGQLMLPLQGNVRVGDEMMVMDRKNV